jgi:hypothetical protein
MTDTVIANLQTAVVVDPRLISDGAQRFPRQFVGLERQQ